MMQCAIVEAEIATVLAAALVLPAGADGADSRSGCQLRGSRTVSSTLHAQVP